MEQTALVYSLIKYSFFKTTKHTDLRVILAQGPCSFTCLIFVPPTKKLRTRVTNIFLVIAEVNLAKVQWKGFNLDRLLP